MDTACKRWDSWCLCTATTMMMSAMMSAAAEPMPTHATVLALPQMPRMHWWSEDEEAMGVCVQLEGWVGLLGWVAE